MKTWLLDNAAAILGKTFEECHCSGLVSRLMPCWTEKPVAEVSTNFLLAGDIVLFSDAEDDLNTFVADRFTGSGVPAHVEERSDLAVTVGVYLGNGKVIVSTEKTGVCLVPFRFVRLRYLRGFRVG